MVMSDPKQNLRQDDAPDLASSSAGDLNIAAQAVFTDASTYPGHLIALCGFDGSGKTTQLNALADHFSLQGFDVFQTRQPTTEYRSEPVVRQFLDNGGTRDHAQALAVMAAADRLKHVYGVLRPALEQGKLVLCDRYVFSSLVYFQERGIEPAFIARMNAGIPKPTLSVFLDTPVPTLLQRLQDRDGPKRKFEERNADVVSRVVNRFRSLSGYLSLVDGAQPAERVTETIIDLFETAISKNPNAQPVKRASFDAAQSDLLRGTSR